MITRVGVPMTSEHVARLETRATDSSGTPDERLVAFRLLNQGKQDLSRIAPVLSDAALAATDDDTLLKYYRAFDDVNDPSFLLPLVHGAESANAAVRLRAADALIDYRSEPAIAELLQAMAESDPDPGVRREAARVYRGGR